MFSYKCPSCNSSIANAIAKGYNDDFYLTQLGILILCGSKNQYEIGQLEMVIDNTCNECMQSIYLIDTLCGRRGIFVDSWEVKPLCFN